MICVSIAASTHEEARASLHEARKAGADLAELRLDGLSDPDIPRLLRDRPLPVIVTVRPEWEGGKFSGNEVDRMALLEEACLHGAEWVDLEFRAYKGFSRRQTKLILSYHDFEKVPSHLESMVSKMSGLEPDLIKVAAKVSGTRDVLDLVRLQKKADVPAVILPMGAFGEPVRILSSSLGSFLTYASLEAGKETAPGQVSISELREQYRVQELDDQTRIFGVFGNPVAHSLSPRIFNRAFAVLGIPAIYVRLPLDDAALFGDLLTELEVEGGSITIPHKQAILPQIDEPDERTCAIGAVNTVVRKNGKLVGTNTDVTGSMEALRDGVNAKWGQSLGGMPVLMVGAGGAARALVHGLLEEGAHVTITNRTQGRAEDLAREMKCSSVPLSGIDRLAPRVIINTTPLGMAPYENDMPPVEHLLGKDVLVMDAVYTPRETCLLREARARGAGIVDGVEYFLRQANHQFAFFFGRTIPDELMKQFNQEL